MSYFLKEDAIHKSSNIIHLLIYCPKSANLWSNFLTNVLVFLLLRGTVPPILNRAFSECGPQKNTPGFAHLLVVQQNDLNWARGKIVKWHRYLNHMKIRVSVYTMGTDSKGTYSERTYSGLQIAGGQVLKGHMGHMHTVYVLYINIWGYMCVICLHNLFVFA